MTWRWPVWRRHEAACLDLVARYEQRGAIFPEITISVEVLPDGRSRNSFELLNP